MRHECNPWCADGTHALLFLLRADRPMGQDYSQAVGIAEAFLAAVGMVSADPTGATNPVSVPAPVTDGRSRWAVFGRYAAVKSLTDISV